MHKAYGEGFDGIVFPDSDLIVEVSVEINFSPNRQPTVEGWRRTSNPPGSSLNRVDVVASYPLANVAGKRVTVVRVSYGPGGFTPPHRHAGAVTAYITKGEIRSQLGGGPLETFTVGQSFFEPPGSTHIVSENASTAEPAELIAVFVADEGAELTTLLN